MVNKLGDGMNEEFQTLPTAIDIAGTSPADAGIHPLDSVIGTEWHAVFEVLDPFVAPRAELEDLHRTAPNSRARDWLTGIMDTRRMIAAVTGIPF